MNRKSIALAALMLWTSLVAREAKATPLFMDEPNPANYLSAGEYSSESGLIDQAQAMPGVARAMQTFASRGYVRDYTSDRAAQSGTGVIVGLGYTIPDHANIGAVVWVFSDVLNSVQETRVVGALVEVDPVTHHTVASSLMVAGQPGFTVQIADMSKTGFNNYSMKESIIDIVEFAGCAFGACAACTPGCVALVLPPAVSTCEGVCCAAGAIGCAMWVFGR